MHTNDLLAVAAVSRPCHSHCRISEQWCRPDLEIVCSIGIGGDVEMLVVVLNPVPAHNNQVPDDIAKKLHADAWTLQRNVADT